MRYALYAAPPADSPLARWGARVLGRDAESGEATPLPDGLPFPPETWAQWTREPRHYGFHGTLKSPFELRDGIAETALTDALRGFAATRRGFVIDQLHVALLDAFAALVPTETPPALTALAEESVRYFDALRAPMSEADRARRLGAPLTARQLDHLEAWGYPYVFEDFRFHMTLTGSLPAPVRDDVVEALATLYAAVEPGLAIDALVLFRQPDRASPFRILARFPFGAPA